MAEVERSVHIDAPRDVVFETITDFESYPEFLPEVERLSVRRTGELTWRVDYFVRVVKRIEYTVELVAEPPSEVRWKMVAGGGPMKDNSGGWRLESEGAGTRAHYRVDVSFGRLVPKALQTKLAEASLPAMLERFKSRAEQRARATGGAS